MAVRRFGADEVIIFIMIIPSDGVENNKENLSRDEDKKVQQNLRAGFCSLEGGCLNMANSNTKNLRRRTNFES